MDETLKETHLRMLYRLLGHKGYSSRVGSLDFSKKVINPKTGREAFLYEETYVQGEEEVIAYARKYNGTRNIFIGRAYRNSNGDVIGTNCITLDLDPIRPKNTASSDEEQRMALLAGRTILSRYPGGYLASSGNGALLVYRLSNPICGEALKEHYGKEKVFIEELQMLIGDKIRIDATNYDQAIIKGIGTLSTKGELSLRRCSQWIMYPVSPYQHSSKLLQRLNEIKPEKQLATNGIDIKAIMSTFNGDRSQADFYLVSYLKQSGVDAVSALVALQANPIGRQTDEKDQARLIAKIYGNTSLLSSSKTGAGSTNNYFEQLFLPKENSQESIRTGFAELDTALGPLPKGELTTFAARSGFGKTTYGCTLAEHWRKLGKRVLYFSTEMHKDYIMHKLVSLSCAIPLQNVIQRSFTDDETKRIKVYEQELLRTSVIICDEFQPTVQLVQNEILKHRPDVVIFDHITQSGTHWEHIAQFARGLKDVTTKENITTVLLSMLNEPPRKQDGSVSSSVRGDVRGSQEIIFLSAIFCLLSNPYEVKGNYQPVDVLVAKNRYGISNQVVHLSVDKSISKFIERSKSHEPNEV